MREATPQGSAVRQRPGGHLPGHVRRADRRAAVEGQGPGTRGHAGAPADAGRRHRSRRRTGRTGAAVGLRRAAGQPGTAAVWPPRSREDFVQAVLPAARAAAGAARRRPRQSSSRRPRSKPAGARSMPVDADGSPASTCSASRPARSWNGRCRQCAHAGIRHGGRMQQVSADFRAYASPETVAAGLCRLLQASPRYAARAEHRQRRGRLRARRCSAAAMPPIRIMPPSCRPSPRSSSHRPHAPISRRTTADAMTDHQRSHEVLLNG